MLNSHYKIQSDASVGSKMLDISITMFNNKGQDKACLWLSTLSLEFNFCDEFFSLGDQLLKKAVGRTFDLLSTNHFSEAGN